MNHLSLTRASLNRLSIYKYSLYEIVKVFWARFSTICRLFSTSNATLD